MGKSCLSTSTAAAVCAIVCALVLVAKADHFVLQNGITLDGIVIAEDDRTVTVDVSTPDIRMSRQINKAALREWQRPVGPAYVRLPVIGEIGPDVTADALRAGLAQARRERVEYVVLVIDSPGGDIGEMNNITDLLINASGEFKIVAFVKEKAWSAAAVIAMTCSEVYMEPKASIGACVPFSITENGPEDVEAKMRSAIEAKMRAATAHGGHADLLIRGMSELDLEIYLAEEGGYPALHTVGPGKLIKSKGQILCLTANEAAECGLAHLATSITDVGVQLIGGPWHGAGRLAWDTVMLDAARQRQQHAREAALARYGPQIANIEQRIAALSATIEADRDTIRRLGASALFETQQLDAEHQQALQIAESQPDPAAWMADAVQTLNARAAEVRQNLEVRVTVLRGEIDAATSESNALRSQEDQMLAGVSN
jgi:ATP-dependent protease ClpP protease subunit